MAGPRTPSTPPCLVLFNAGHPPGPERQRGHRQGQARPEEHPVDRVPGRVGQVSRSQLIGIRALFKKAGPEHPAEPGVGRCRPEFLDRTDPTGRGGGRRGPAARSARVPATWTTSPTGSATTNSRRSSTSRTARPGNRRLAAAEGVDRAAAAAVEPVLQNLLTHANGLPVADEVRPEVRGDPGASQPPQRRRPRARHGVPSSPRRCGRP